MPVHNLNVYLLILILRTALNTPKGEQDISYKSARDIILLLHLFKMSINDKKLLLSKRNFLHLFNAEISGISNKLHLSLATTKCFKGYLNTPRFYMNLHFLKKASERVPEFNKCLILIGRS